jgi:hypothetical protein
MSAGKHNFTCEQGATFDRTITYKDGQGTAIDLSDYTARMHVREYTGGDLIVALYSDTTQGSSNGYAILNGPVDLYEDGANGNIRLLISAANTANLTSGSLKYDLEIENSVTSEVIRLIEGKFNVVPEITR